MSVALVAAAAASPSLFDFPDAPFSAPSLPDWSATAQKVPVESITIEPATLAAAVDPASVTAATEAPKAETAKTLITVQGNLQKQPAPMTEPVAPQAQPAPEKQEEPAKPMVQNYTISSGDTLSALAQKFGVTTQTLIWANDLGNPDSLKLGAELRIPPVSGVVHTVKPGDTLNTLAERYQVEVSDITAFTGNKITDPNALLQGQEVMVPRGVKPIDPPPTRLVGNTQPIPANGAAPVAAPPATTAPRPASAAPAAPAAPAPQPAAPAPVPGGALQWPTYGPIFTFFSAGHRGLDISPPFGTPVYAAEGGVVVEAATGFNSGYGTYVMIDHGNGYQTMYAHLSAMFVAPGQRVSRGDNLGRVGVTGIATGPHLHFEVHKNGVAINPIGNDPFTLPR